MPDAPAFEPFRDVAFKGLLSTAFKSFPRRVEQILTRESWQRFTDFMYAVARSGHIVARFEGKPSKKTIDERGVEAAIKEMYDQANTSAMLKLLSGGFFGEQEGYPDPVLAAEALEPLGIQTWRDFNGAVLDMALAFYSEASRGRTLLETATPESLLFYGFVDLEKQTPAVLEKLQEAFSITTPDHLLALSEAFWSGELTLEDLDRAVGNPQLLTELVNRSPSNLHKGIVFSKVPKEGSMGYTEAYA